MTKRTEIDWDMLDAILRFGATCVDCAEILKTSEDAIQRNIKRRFKMTFAQYRDRKMAPTRQKLRAKQYEMAVEFGNVTMLIWLGKQMLGQSEKVTHVEEDELEFTDE